jgi:uncharacterized protein YndB with AHSA1/START domain
VLDTGAKPPVTRFSRHHHNALCSPRRASGENGMRILKWLGIVLAALAALFVLGGLLLPDRSVVERETVIARPPAVVFAALDGFARFNEWSPWRDDDPTATYTLEGPARGVGARLRWQGEQGAGSQEIIALDPPRSIAVALDFGQDGGAQAQFLLRPEGDRTRLTWRFEFAAEGSWSGRWFSLLLDRFVGADYERGLAALKTLLESEPAPPAAPPPPPALPPAAAPPAGEATGGDADSAAPTPPAG